jgi:RsmE family RNA methyltransferase
VEVGIRRFIFFRSDFSQKLILSESKKSRLLAIAREALEQCGGLIMPEIEFYEQSPSLIGEGTHITLDTTGTSLKITEISQNENISIWVGPEGGWSPKEREKMRDNGFIFARF